MTEDVLQRLAATIRSRRSESAANSYTRQLIDAGPERCAKKLGEEATETVIAALGTDDRALAREAADLVYHLLVLLECRQVSLDQVMAELKSRMGTSGLVEKASRPGAGSDPSPKPQRPSGSEGADPARSSS
jgi:phosphoribosyl-ATP pyrophosphohydrolase